METAPNIPRSCETCLYMRVHDKCDNCLGNGPQYKYRNWQTATFGEALALEHERQVSGARNIVISGSGEAEVNAKWAVKEAYEHLVHVSEACGYITYSPKFSGDEAALRVLVNGEHFVIWKGGVLDRIQDAPAAAPGAATRISSKSATPKTGWKPTAFPGKGNGH